MKACAYIRVSSASQSTSMQRARIRAVSKARGDTIDRWYEEKQSARTMDRPVLGSVRVEAREGSIRRLYVYRIDRLTRSGIRDTLALLDELQSGGCEVVNCDDGFSLQHDNPARDVVVACMAWAAQMERLAISERIRAARERVAARGGAWGRPRRMNPRQVTAAREARRSGATIREIAVALKVPKSTVAAAVCGPSQKGRRVGGAKDLTKQRGRPSSR